MILKKCILPNVASVEIGCWVEIVEKRYKMMKKYPRHSQRDPKMEASFYKIFLKFWIPNFNSEARVSI